MHLNNYTNFLYAMKLIAKECGRIFCFIKKNKESLYAFKQLYQYCECLKTDCKRRQLHFLFYNKYLKKVLFRVNSELFLL